MNPSGIIILDGPDGTGKTTLAQYFINRYQARYLHLTYRFKNNMFEYNTAAIELAAKWANEGYLVIIDRLWMSNYVYDKVFRKGPHQAYLGRFIDRLVLRYSGIYVICLPENSREYLNDYNDLKSTRIEMYSRMDEIYNEYAWWWQKIQKEKWPHAIRYDMYKEGRDIQLFAQSLLERLGEERENGYMLNPMDKNFSGSLAHGEVLFIDAKANRRKGLPWYPRHSYTEANIHLAAVLELAGIPEYKLMWTNIESGLWKELTSKYELQPIALGHDAYRAMVWDSGSYHFYGKPDCHITPEEDLRARGQTTFMQRMIHQITQYTKLFMEK
ncbi:MAG TPA: hypothetical protein VD999_07795 [Vitreimonas sp.]|nr:hypothetical protein [Vitreimonas sp.]